jgi:hypothetical protein
MPRRPVPPALPCPVSPADARARRRPPARPPPRVRRSLRGAGTALRSRPRSSSWRATWSTIVACCAPQLQRALGVALEEVGDDQRRQVVADGQRRADAQLAVAGATFEHAFDRRRPLDQFDGLRQQGLPEFVEAQGLAEPVEKLRVVLSFEFGERRAGRRLRQRKLSAARETLSWRATATNTPIWRKVNRISTVF